jgi:hypothetical protein
MAANNYQNQPCYNIAPTEKGWLLVIQNEHCSVTQVFSSVSSARRAVEQLLEFFPTTATESSSAHQAA